MGNLAEVVQALQDISTPVIKHPTQTTWGLQAVVKDPDGRSVEVTQR